MRTGNEPIHARSPLRLRIALAVWGLLWGLGGMVGFAAAHQIGWAAVFGVIALVAVVDICVVMHHIHQGPHYQPGRDIPPYRPVDHHRR